MSRHQTVKSVSVLQCTARSCLWNYCWWMEELDGIRSFEISVFDLLIGPAHQLTWPLTKIVSIDGCCAEAGRQLDKGNEWACSNVCHYLDSWLIWEMFEVWDNWENGKKWLSRAKWNPIRTILVKSKVSVFLGWMIDFSLKSKAKHLIPYLPCYCYWTSPELI